MSRPKDVNVRLFLIFVSITIICLILMVRLLLILSYIRSWQSLFQFQQSTYFRMQLSLVIEGSASECEKIDTWIRLWFAFRKDIIILAKTSAVARNETMPECPRHFARLLPCGRLGNRMTQYANLVALNQTYPELDIVMEEVSVLFSLLCRNSLVQNLPAVNRTWRSPLYLNYWVWGNMSMGLMSTEDATRAANFCQAGMRESLGMGEKPALNCACFRR